MLKVNIEDGHTGSTNKLRISENGAALITDLISEVPPIGTPNQFRYFSGLLGTTGLNSGTTDMATTADTYYIEASDTFDYRIQYIILLVADVGADHNKWGNVGVTATGLDLYTLENGIINYMIEKAKTFGQAIVQTGLFNSHTGGSNTQAFQFANWSGSQEAQTVVIPVGQIIPGGLRIGRGTQDRIILNTNDTFAGQDEMFCRVIGYKHYP